MHQVEIIRTSFGWMMSITTMKLQDYNASNMRGTLNNILFRIIPLQPAFGQKSLKEILKHNNGVDKRWVNHDF